MIKVQTDHLGKIRPQQKVIQKDLGRYNKGNRFWGAGLSLRPTSEMVNVSFERLQEGSGDHKWVDLSPGWVMGLGNLELFPQKTTGHGRR